MQTRTAMRDHFTSRIMKIKIKFSRCYLGCGTTGIANGTIKWYNHFAKLVVFN